MKEHSIFISPPLIQARMTGAVRCIKNARHTTLVYEDSTEETVLTDKLPTTIDWENWFSIVGGIQSLRKTAPQETT